MYYIYWPVSGFPTTETVHEAFAGFPGNSAASAGGKSTSVKYTPANAAASATDETAAHYSGIVDLSQKSLVNSAFSRPLHHTSTITTAAAAATISSQSVAGGGGGQQPRYSTAVMTKVAAAGGATYASSSSAAGSPTVSTAFLAKMPSNQLSGTGNNGQIAVTFTTSAAGKSFSLSPTKSNSSAYFAAHGMSSSPFPGGSTEVHRSSSSSSSASSVSFQSPVGGGGGGGSSKGGGRVGTTFFARYL
jgi:hypothetical protein